jgi:hypothetical protein
MVVAKRKRETEGVAEAETYTRFGESLHLRESRCLAALQIVAAISEPNDRIEQTTLKARQETRRRGRVVENSLRFLARFSPLWVIFFQSTQDGYLATKSGVRVERKRKEKKRESF